MDVDESYDTSLKRFIVERILPLAIPPSDEYDEQIKYLTDEERMCTWKEAFTDYSYDPNPSKNYERLEKLGDALLKAVFNIYLTNKISSDPEFADMTNSDMAEQDRNHMSEVYQTQLALALGLKPFVRSRVSVVPMHDIFESLVGALYTVTVRGMNQMRLSSNSSLSTQSQGDGFNVVYNLIYRIFAENPLNRKMSVKGPVNKVKEFYDKMAWSGSYKCMENVTIIYSQDRSIGEVTIDSFNCKLVLPQHAMKSLEGILTDPLLADETNSSVEGAILAAYTAASIKLHRMGMTEEWAIRNQEARLKQSASSHLFEKAQELATSKGFSNVHVSTTKFRGEVKYIMLVGNKQGSDELVVIHFVEAPVTVTTKKMYSQLVCSFIESSYSS